MGENNSKWNNWQRTNFQNIQAVHATLYQKANLVKKWAEDLNRHFSNEDIQIANNTRKDVRHCSLLKRRRQWQPTPVLSPGKSHGWRSVVGYSLRGCEESDITERLHSNFSFSCTGEGNGNPLQYFCLENPRDRGAWWAAIYGVAQSRTQLTWLSSSSSSIIKEMHIKTTTLTNKLQN